MPKKTVSIGISAHNSEKRIATLLESILVQKHDNFSLHKIQIACDGCTDKTADIVAQYVKKYSYIKLIDDKKRVGKSARINEFYKNLDSDIFIVMDDDIELKDDLVIKEMVKAFDRPEIGLVGGNVYPAAQNTFIGKTLELYEKFWLGMIYSINQGNCVHSHAGPLTAGRKEFLQHVVIPIDIVAEDHFLYFKAIEMGYQYKLAKNAVVYFKVPSTLRDFLNQTTRFHASADNIKNYFGSWVEKYYHIPFATKLRAYIITFFKSPIYLLSALLLQSFQRVLGSTFGRNTNTQLWTRVSSSK